MNNSHDELTLKTKINNLIILFNISLVLVNIIGWIFFVDRTEAFYLFISLNVTGVSILVFVLLAINYIHRKREVRILKELTDFSSRHRIVFKSSNSAMEIHRFIENHFKYLDKLTVEDRTLFFSFKTGLSDMEMKHVLNLMKILRLKLLLDYNSIDQIRY